MNAHADGASGLGFLNRIYHHLSLVTSLDSFPRANNDEREEDLTRKCDFASFFVPEKSTAKTYIDCYFEHSSVTFRFLDRHSVEALFQSFYEGESKVVDDLASTGLLLAIMAVG
jgi:hypothetical protein